MGFARAGLALLVLLALAPAAQAADGTLGQAVTVSAVVPTGDNSYEPAFFVDWLDRACPATVGAARASAKGDTTRGLGIAEVTGDGTDTVPVRAKVLLEQPKQRVCWYGGGGGLAGEKTLTAEIVMPPLDLEQPVDQPWTLSAIARVRIDGRIHEDPLGWALLVNLHGRRADKLSHVTCNRKRLDLIPSRLHLSDTSISYSGPLKADNSKNYDPPVPIAYRGHARFSFHAKLEIGRAPLEFPITSTTGQVSKLPAARRLGEWGVPYFKIDARFRARGFHPFAGKPSCPSHLKALMLAGINSPVMPGQGDDWIGGNQDNPAGVKHEAPAYPAP